MKQPHTFLDPTEALPIVLATVQSLDVETVELPDALGRVLARRVSANTDQPRFRKAAVDGFGVAAGARDRPVVVVGSIVAGEAVDPARPVGLKHDEALRIMTGAVVPPDVERVIRFEHTERLPERPGDNRAWVRDTVREEAANIAERGENIRAGEPLMDPRVLEAVDLGIMASQGHWEVPVVRRPAVAVLSTGSELYSPAHGTIPDYAIYDSNAVMLSALARRCGATATSLGIVDDDQTVTTDTLRDAMTRYDVIICSGGVSMGDKDFVPTALEQLGATIHFHGLAMKPGKPTLFATLGETLVFGLPGNPVSSFAQFELLIAPALSALQGVIFRPHEAALPLAHPFSRSKADRHEFVPGYIRGGKIYQVVYRGSGHMSALASASVVFRIDRGVTEVAAGETVYVRFIRPEDHLSPDFGDGQV